MAGLPVLMKMIDANPPVVLMWVVQVWRAELWHHGVQVHSSCQRSCSAQAPVAHNFGGSMVRLDHVPADDVFMCTIHALAHTAAVTAPVQYYYHRQLESTFTVLKCVLCVYHTCMQAAGKDAHTPSGCRRQAAAQWQDRHREWGTAGRDHW